MSVKQVLLLCLLLGVLALLTCRGEGSLGPTAPDLAKGSVAGRKSFSRPVLRLFATYANWSDGLRGFVGGVPFQDRRNDFAPSQNDSEWTIRAVDSADGW
jgi:LamB porin